MNERARNGLAVVISRFALAGLISVSASTAFAGSHIEPIKQVLPELRNAIVVDSVIKALRQYNDSRKHFTQTDIDGLEQTWQAQVDSADQPLVSSVVGNDVAKLLRQVIKNADDIVTEIGVIDAQGLSIAQSSPNSDIWQGDEPKWQKTFLVGPEAVFIDEIEFDESTQTTQAQANFTIVDPATGEPIGAVTVGIDVETIM